MKIQGVEWGNVDEYTEKDEVEDAKKCCMKGLKELHAEIDKRDYKNIEGLKSEITAKEYDYLLNVLPPLRWNIDKGVFYMMEYQTGSLTTKCFIQKGRFYAEIVDTMKEWKS